jgi:hypothetical protein
MVRIPALKRNSFFIHSVQTEAGIQPPSYPMSTAAVSMGVKTDME